ncbi:quercetin 2,3-dioxygenase [Flindersiella endophytica]
MTFDPAGYLLTPADGTPIWFLDTRMTVKAGGDQTGGAYTLIEWSAPEGFGPPLHVHNKEDEAFYLLDGQIAINCGDRRWTAGPGDFVFLPHGIPHSFLVTEGVVRGLQLTTPSGFEHFAAELGRPAEHSGLPTPSEPDVPHLIDVSRRYDYQIVGPPPGTDQPTA